MQAALVLPTKNCRIGNACWPVVGLFATGTLVVESCRRGENYCDWTYALSCFGLSRKRTAVAAIDDRQTLTKTYSKPITGADVLVESLIRHGVDVLFAYPGGASMPMHQALTWRKDRFRTILPRHEQGGIFAAEGYARVTGKPGVVMATSGPGALNLVTGLADAKMDSIPLIAITGQVPTHVIGTDAFQETPMVEVSRAITKHHYLVQHARDIARIVKEAFHLARLAGRARC